MEWLFRIGAAATKVLAFLMRVAGLVIAVNLLLIHPERASAPDLFLAGLLLLGGQAAKDLLLGLVDRLLTPPSHHVPPPQPPSERPRRRK